MPPLIGAIAFLGTLLIAIFFEEERTTFVDIALHLFMQAKYGEVAIQNYRFVSAITQWLPTQLLNAEVDMKTVQLVYSLVFPLFYGAAWAFTHFVLKAKQWALAWALMWLTFATHTHFWIQSELPQGLAVFVMALGLMSYTSEKKWASVLAKAALPPLLLTVAFAHPLLIVPVSFSFGLLWLLGISKRRDILVSGIIYYACFLLRSTVFSTPYDSRAGNGFPKSVAMLKVGEIPYSITNFLSNITTTYYAFLLVLIVGIWLIWKAGHRLSALWTLAAVVGHLLLVALSYPTELTQDFYIENLYLPAGFMAAAGLAFGLREKKIQFFSKPMALALVVLALLRVGHIAWIGNTIYTPRLEYLQAMLDAHKHERVIFKETPELQKELIMTWGTGYEAWVLSARNDKATQGFLIHPNPAEVQWAIAEPERLILIFHQPKFEDLPQPYFIQPEVVQKYVVK